MILTYHEIVDTYSPYIYSVTRANLKDHLSLVARRTHKDNASGQLQVTFDDGHISHYESALPVLDETGIKATFFVTAGWTDRESNYMKRAQLRELFSRGHQVHAHGWTHRMLTRCTPAELYQELADAKHFLEDILGASVTGMSAPHGRWNDRVLQTCAYLGYANVYISEPYIGPLIRCGVCLAGRVMVTRKSSPLSLDKGASGRSKAPIRGKLLQGAKAAARMVLGEETYRTLWRRMGDKAQELPQIASARARPAVLQLISSGGYYGAESMLLNLSKTLSDEGVNVIVGVFSNSQNPHLEVADRAKQKGLATHSIACHGRLDRHAIRKIRNLIYQHGIDIIHAHGSKANAYAALAVRRLSVPLVATYHIDWPDRGHLLRLYHVLDRVVLRKFSRIVAVSEPIARSLRASGIGSKKISTVKNGIDLEPFIQARAAAAQAKREAETCVVGVVGRLTPQKGHRFLLDAAPDLLRSYPNLMFVFVGNGPELPNLKRQTALLKVERHVTFAGSREDMPAVYASLDILVLPSLNEGMPMTLIEALAARLPVIATSVGDVAKLIVHDKTGLLVEPGKPGVLKEALATLLSDPQKSAAIALEGQRVVCRDYSAAAMTSRYLALYAELVNPAGVPEMSREAQ